MKLYPTTNTILEGNDIQVETLNQETRECFQVSNGGIDQYNLELGTSTCGTGGLESSNFALNSWNHFFTGVEGSSSQTSSVFEVAVENYAVRQHRYATRNHSNIKAGMCSGVLQVRYWLNSLAQANAGDMGYDDNIYSRDLTCDFSIYVNGSKVGETDVVSKGTRGAATIPFRFYHPGGNIQVDLYAGANGMGSLVDLSVAYSDVSSDFRMRIQNFLYTANVRVR